MNNSSPQFVALFLQGHSIREFEAAKTTWNQARFIASTMSKEASKIKFPWEKSRLPKANVSEEVWTRFTLEITDKKATIEQVKKVLNLN
jgi:hypothetical protein